MFLIAVCIIIAFQGHPAVALAALLIWVLSKRRS